MSNIVCYFIFLIICISDENILSSLLRRWYFIPLQFLQYTSGAQKREVIVWNVCTSKLLTANLSYSWYVSRGLGSSLKYALHRELTQWMSCRYTSLFRSGLPSLSNSPLGIYKQISVFINTARESEERLVEYAVSWYIVGWMGGGAYLSFCMLDDTPDNL